MKTLLSAALTLAVLFILTGANDPLQARSQLDPGTSELLPINKPPSVPERFFGMSTHSLRDWPTVPMSDVRLWNTGTNWAVLNPQDGVYDWTILDKWLAATQEHGVSHVMYTLAMTPQWASSNPNDQTCKFSPGACDPPDDLNTDGSGTDQHWKNFVTAVAIHAAGRIKLWEVWNEPVNAFFWNGTFAQMVRMAQDARTIILSIDPTSRMLTPPNGANKAFGEKWWKSYAALGGLQYADIIGMHGYVNLPPQQCGNYPKASDFIIAVNNLKSIMATYNASDKPIFDTESSWGHAAELCFTDPDLQAAFLAQFYLFHRSSGVRRLYWFAYDDGRTGQLYDPATKTLNEAGVAYQQVYTWMLGNTMTEHCSSVGNVWTCGFSGGKGYLAQAIWDADESCSQGKCQTINYQVDKSYTQYRTLDGKTIPINNNEVPIGAKPILLENHSR